MTSSPPRPLIRRLWPQQLRTRLAVFYSLLFEAAGLGVVALAYTLAVSLFAPSRGPRLQRLTSSEQAILRLCKPEPSAKKLIAQCQHLIALVSPTQNGDVLAALKIAAAIAVVVVVVGAIALGWVAAGRALRPVRSITEAALRASELRLGQRLALSGPEDELKQLGDTLDLMLERLDAAFTSQRRFIANAAHELRTPLTAMRTAIDVTLSKPQPTPEQLEEMAERVRRSVLRAEATIEALLTLASSEFGTTTISARSGSRRRSSPRRYAETGFCWSGWWPTWWKTPCATTIPEARSGSAPTGRTAEACSRSRTPAQWWPPTRSRCCSSHSPALSSGSASRTASASVSRSPTQSPVLTTPSSLPVNDLAAGLS
jgi:hypothetical protein